ncbi:MAG: cytochrome b/b6 domain-containing protein [Rhodopseudomonas sp.]|uniref:cytochrome b/b6 domain-containing protein n=1 Tax=Rhodopseudomonas sp. TaxID=1078 RepID=UPI0018220776|nr:cytochrome b/b6 domain-containing protein [Rhodopseudomonas sp.]NVN87934.1 cytochrome b/b6 domain-containing protein [Rhodopseudomonas sp.]
MDITTPSGTYRAYDVWDAPTRWFHWINALAVLGLIGIGVMLLNDDALGISPAAKFLLKQIHVTLGYLMAANLLWRFVWAFRGNRYAKWSAMLPQGPGYWNDLQGYGHAFLSGEPRQYVGHNPAGRLGIAILLVLLLVQAATGLILAGTDLFWPPFGGLFAGRVAASGVDPAMVSPLVATTIDPVAYKAMRAFRSPVVFTHLYGFYGLACVILLHVGAVVVTEIREGGSITSAMFTGRKVLSRPPQDQEPD